MWQAREFDFLQAAARGAPGAASACYGDCRRALGLNSFHTAQLFQFISHNDTTELPQLISLSVPHSTSLNSSDLTHLTQLPLNSSHSTHLNSSLSTHLTQVNSLKVQCFCVQRNMNAFAPPAPKWLSQVMI